MKFSNTYQQYKTDTNDFCQFLVNLSEYPVDPPPSPLKTSPPTRRLKGKARKAAQTTPTGVKPSLTPKKVTFTVDKLVEMAQKISIDPIKIAKVSRSILAKLERCINIRQHYLDLFRKKSAKGTEAIGDLERENRQHTYFVHILRVVLSILKCKGASGEGYQKVARQAEPFDVDSSSALPDLNSFSLLDIEDGESEDELEIQTSVTVPKNPPNNPSSAGSINRSEDSSTNDEQTLEEYSFASFCLFTDLHQLLRNALEHWKLYKTGEINLETATLIHNTSLAAMRQAEKDFIEAFQDRFSAPPGYWDIALGFYNALARQRGIDSHTFSGRENFLKSAERGDFNKVEMKDISQLVCLKAAHFLTPVADTFKQLCEFPHGIYTIHSNNPGLKLFLRFVNGLSRLQDIKVYQLDDFTYGLQDLNRPNQGPMAVWLVFATNLFLDTNCILGDDVSRPYDELQSAARHTHSTLSRLNAETFKGLGICKQPQYNGEYFEMIHDYMRLIEEDMLKNLLHTVAGPGHIPDTITHHPALFGTLLLWLRIRMHKLGSLAGKTDRCFLLATHAYNAFRELGGLDIRWPEIEKFSAYHTPEKIFAGRTPRTLEECLKCYHLAMGASTVMVQGQPPRARKLGGDLYLKDRLKESDIILILQDWAWTNPLQRLGYKVTDELLARLVALKINQVPLKRSRRMDLVAQILTVKDLVECEIPYLQFDYWGLCLQSIEIFRTIHSELDSYFKRVMGENYDKPTEESPQIVLGHILRYSVFERQHNIDILRPQLPYLSSHCIKVGSQTMKEILQSSSPSVDGNLLPPPSDAPRLIA